MARTATPEKSFIAVTTQGSNIRHSIKFINQKGTFVYSPTCDSCQHQGNVQDNLGYAILNHTCDRDEGTWRKQKNYSYLDHKPCKFFKPKEVHPNATL